MDSGRYFIIGFSGTKVSDELAKLISEYKIGGAILFKRNLESPEQILKLTEDLKKAGGENFIIGIDEEGGRVSRLPKPFTKFKPITKIRET